MYKLLISIFIVFLFIASCAQNNLPIAGGVYEGKTVGIIDGDTINVLIDGQSYKVRLAQIDTPEKKQPYGSKSKQILSDLIFDKSVTIKIETKDRYGRFVADIYYDDKHINAELVKLGAAWVYRKYIRDKSLFIYENNARESKIGLWSLPESERQPPWEWRKKN